MLVFFFDASRSMIGLETHELSLSSRGLHGDRQRFGTLCFVSGGNVGYLEKNLIPGEAVIYKTGYHWIVLFWPVLAGIVLAGVAFGLLAHRWTSTQRGGSHAAVVITGVLMLASATVLISAAVIKRNSTEIAVSNKRVLIKTGLVARKSTEVLLPKVESIEVDETVLGRILGYGSVIVRGTGGTFETFRRISQPNEFRRQVQGQIGSPASR